jgi:segregation and condensation protein A
MATQLMEIKSRMMLPRHEEIEEEPVDDPRQELVSRLLEYKRYKEAANLLEDRARQWQLRFERQGDDLNDRPNDPASQPIHEVELWDLVSAFSRVIKQKSVQTATKIRYDDTPIEVHMERINERLAAEGRVLFTDFFEPGMHRSRMVGLFLALLELIRHHHAAVEQTELFGEIWIMPMAATAAVADQAA